jgi:nitronate monooxygenase
MFPNTAFTELTGAAVPIIQAPMAGGATTPELVANVSNAGGLGSLAAAMLSPEAIAESVAEVRARTREAFNVNLFVLQTPAAPDAARLRRALELLQPVKDELGLPAGTPPVKFCEDFGQQFDALLEAQPPVASFTFGILDARRMAALKARGALIMGTATTVAEARAWEAAGADMVCAQGAEAGAHRGTFLGRFEDAMIGTLALVPQIADAVRIPVIAAGGVMDGRGIAAALMLGASAVQMGTAFLTCPEAGIPQGWKDRLRVARDDETAVTTVFSGRPARGLMNDFMRRYTPVAGELLPYPITNALTGPIRQAASKANKPEYLSLWAGQAAALSRGLSATDLVGALVKETRQVLSKAR